MSQVSIVTSGGLDAAVATHVNNAQSATRGALAGKFVNVPASIADGQVPVYQASSGTFIPGTGGGGGGGPITSNDITDATAAGKAILTGANAAAQRTSMGAWDGAGALVVRRYTGSAWPVRDTANLPAGAAVLWIGPAQPLTGGNYSVDGDLAAVIS